eukprot:jgi/Chrpa1/13537/Chrysochromulina_OHIO_Genome00002712-RA
MQISFDLSRELVIALWAEFLGTFIFQFFGGTEQVGPVNGVVLTVCIYMTAKYSGGNLNPAVSAGLCLTGILPPFKAGLYAVAQISGSIAAAFLAAFIDLDENLDAAGLDNWGEYKMPYLIPPGCHRTLPDRVRGSVFVLEMLGTFVLVATVHAVAVAKPGFGDHAPFAIGLAIVVVVGGAGHITGGFFNPARFIGPALVFGCDLHNAWLYLIAQLLGGALASLNHTRILEKLTPAPPLAKSEVVVEVL